MALVFTGITFSPDETCEFSNHDQYVVQAHRAGIALLTAAAALAAAAFFLAAGAFGNRPRYSKVRHVLACLLSFALAGIVALIGLLELVAFDCLE